MGRTQVQKKNQFSWRAAEDRSNQHSFILPTSSWEAWRGDEATGPNSPSWIRSCHSERVWIFRRSLCCLQLNLQLALYWLAVELSDVIRKFFFCSFVSLCIYRYHRPLTHISILWWTNAFAFMIYSLSGSPLFLSFHPVLSLLSPSTQTAISRSCPPPIWAWLWVSVNHPQASVTATDAVKTKPNQLEPLC